MIRTRRSSPARIHAEPPEHPPRTGDLEAAREAALKLLERRRRARRDIARRLLEKGYESPVIEAVLDRLASVGLVNDVEYARAYLSERMGRKAAGWRRLELELRARGIAAEDIAQARVALEAEFGPADEVGTARRVLEQSARRYASLGPRTRRQRLYALLLRRGFDPAVARQALEIQESDA